MERDCTLSSENGNVIFRNRRHLILTDEKFTKKFSNDNIISAFTKLPEGVAPLQLVKTCNLIDYHQSFETYYTKCNQNNSVMTCFKKTKQVH